MEWINSFVGSIESRDIDKLTDGIFTLVDSNSLRFIAKGSYEHIIQKLLICESEEYDIFDQLDLLLTTLAKDGYDIITPLVDHLTSAKDNNIRIILSLHLKQILQHVRFT